MSPRSDNNMDSAEDEQEMPMLPISSARESKQLDAIVELNYEASSDEEDMLETRAV